MGTRKDAGRAGLLHGVTLGDSYCGCLPSRGLQPTGDLMNLYLQSDELAGSAEVIVRWEANVLQWFRTRHCAAWKGAWGWVDQKLRVALFRPDSAPAA